MTKRRAIMRLGIVRRFSLCGLLLLSVGGCAVGELGTGDDQESTVQQLDLQPTLSRGHCIALPLAKTWGQETGQCLEENTLTGTCRVYESGQCVKGRARPLIETPAVCISASTQPLVIDDTTCGSLSQ